MDDWKKAFVEHRTWLISFAFRMTGSLAEAEDLVQDTFMEFADADRSEIRNVKAWLTKVCSNKALDHLKSAYKRRETYPGTWLPDAVPDSFQMWSQLSDGETQEKHLLLSESLTTSFLLLIERLSPEERVVYLLSEIFEYAYKDIAEYLGKSEAACRKIAQRAREAVQAHKVKFKPTPESSVQLIAKFFEAAKNGDQSTLAELLMDASEFWSDGGGKVPAASKVLRDKLYIAGFFVGIGRTNVFRSAEFRMELSSVNGRPGVIISKQISATEWAFDTIMSFEIEDGHIARIYAQRNPDKLKSLLQV